MTEIEKLYELAGIKKQYCGWLDMGDLDTQYTYVRCDTLEEFNDTAMMSRTSYSSDEEDWDKPSIEYPPFTAEKQIELIKWLALQDSLNIIIWKNDDMCMEFYKYSANESCFEDCLANIFNNCWQDLIEEERNEIREILE